MSLNEQPKPFSEFSFYITAQIERINLALQGHSKMEDLMLQMKADIKKQQKRLESFDNKIKLLEIYQSQNFKNNERIFNSQPIYDVINEKICLLQQMQSNLISRETGQNKENLVGELLTLERRLQEAQAEIQRIKSKNIVLNRFRREISPTLPNCDSTKDISIDYSTKKELKKIQNKILESVNQKLKAFEKKYFNHSLNHSISKDTSLNPVKNPSPSMNTKESDAYQISRDNKNVKVDDYNFKSKIDQYYNQATQKQQLKANKKVRQSKGSKSKSKSKTKNKNSISKQKSISLKSVTQYLKLNNPK